MLIDSVTVSAEGVKAISDVNGAFTITLPQTNVEKFTPPRFMPTLTWHPENGTFSWNGSSGDVSVTVRSLQGITVARAVLGKSLNRSTFSLANLSQGIYMVGISSQGKETVYKINNIRTGHGQSYSLMSQNRSSASKAAATTVGHTLTFTKNNFDTLTLTVPSGTNDSVAARMKSPYPLKNILKLFLDPSIPDPGPTEAPTEICLNTTATPPNRIGGQLNMHNFVLIGEDCRRICVVINGKLAWHYDTDNTFEDDDIWVLSNGNILHAHMTYLEEITPKKQQVFRINFQGYLTEECHTCMPIGLDSVMYMQNIGNASNVCIYSIKAGKTVFTKSLKELSGGTHMQCRRVRYTSRGTYMCAGENVGTIFEYDKNWNLVSSLNAGSFWSAAALKNGNTDNATKKWTQS
jgi:hypothetical protein